MNVTRVPWARRVRHFKGKGSRMIEARPRFVRNHAVEWHDKATAG